MAQDYIYVQDAPRIPEPMVFDMVRPLGAKKGELEANMLVQRNLSGPHRSVNGGPEVEYAIADGFALELELPVDDLHVAEYKLGVQGTFGTFAGGRAVHGVQYLGVYDRASPRWENSLTYLLGYRFDHRWSTMTMIGIGNVVGGRARGNLLFNHSTFYDISDATTLGFEINTHRGAGRYTLLMPQVHQALTGSLKLQAGLGVVRGRSAAWRPQVAFRLIREF
ncbi:MAG: hypothetical protein FJX40_12255 [Alphaproteobacteria bacterium]|nr:hypothetical protein [Alphaproteobacteria bacterium]